jgi:hypothetical protein
MKKLLIALAAASTLIVGSVLADTLELADGTLAVDMVDAAQNMLAWEAVAQQRVGRSTTGITQEQANEVMAHVMAEFPGRPN